MPSHTLPRLRFPYFPICAADSCILPIALAKRLAVILGSSLSFISHIQTVSQSFRLFRGMQLLLISTATTLICNTVFSFLDCYINFLIDLSTSILTALKSISSTPVRMILSKKGSWKALLLLRAL